jgi:hypothetical protein
MPGEIDKVLEQVGKTIEQARQYAKNEPGFLRFADFAKLAGMHPQSLHKIISDQPQRLTVQLTADKKRAGVIMDSKATDFINSRKKERP